MGKATNLALRQSVLSLYKKGVSKTEIAKLLQIGRTTVYNIINRFNKEGESGLIPNYSNCGKNRPDHKNLIYRSIRCMRKWHPSWGAERILAKISLARPNWILPCTRTVNYWFNWENPPKAKSTPVRIPHRIAKKVHEIWQVDAKEELVTLDGEKHCWLNIRDEFSGTIIDPPVFSL